MFNLEAVESRELPHPQLVARTFGIGTLPNDAPSTQAVQYSDQPIRFSGAHKGALP